MSQMLCLLPCHYPACCNSDEPLLQEHVSVCRTPRSLPRLIYSPRQLCLQVQNFFSQNKTSMARRPNFNQNKPFRHARSCHFFFGNTRWKRSCTPACAVNKCAAAAPLRILLLNSSTHISFSFSLVSDFSPYLCNYFFFKQILKMDIFCALQALRLRLLLHIDVK